MALSKQAKVLSKTQVNALLHYVSQKRQPIRNCVIVLLSIKAGLRAKEIAHLQWLNVLNADGEIGDVLEITDKVSKGSSGRVIPLNKELKMSLSSLLDAQPTTNARSTDANQEHFVVQSERSCRTSAQAIVNMLRHWYLDLGFVGASSHSGRRTFITNAAKKVFEAGGSLRDVQQLAGHKSLAMTQRYIEGDVEAKRRLVDLI